MARRGYERKKKYSSNNLTQNLQIKQGQWTPYCLQNQSMDTIPLPKSSDGHNTFLQNQPMGTIYFYKINQWTQYFYKIKSLSVFF